MASKKRKLFAAIRHRIPDATRIAKAVKEQRDKETRKFFIAQFGTRLKQLSEGRFWFKRPDPQLKKGERITAYASSKNGKNGVLAGSRGSVFVTQDRGETWSTLADAILIPEIDEHGDYIIGAAFSANDEIVVLASNEGRVFIRQEGGEWKLSQSGFGFIGMSFGSQISGTPEPMRFCSRINTPEGPRQHLTF